MAENLVTGSIQAPGFSGLDIQDASVQLSSGFALEAFNCVIDQYGRVGARKGWTKVNSSAASTGNFRAIYELVKDDGNTVIYDGEDCLIARRGLELTILFNKLDKPTVQTVQPTTDQTVQPNFFDKLLLLESENL